MKKHKLIKIMYYAVVALVLSLAAACSIDSTNERTDCDIQRGPCVRMTGSGTEVTFDITPRPVKAMSDLLFTVTVRKNGRPVSRADVSIDLTMPGMIMGKNSPKLSPGKDGQYTGRGVITRCLSGRKVWMAQVTATSKQGTECAAFIFEVI